MSNDFSLNLKLLCSYYKSIADVCRRLDVNRSQFNRYLNGRSQPSANMLLKLCTFFGVEKHEILLPHSQFERLVKVRPKRAEADEPSHPLWPHLQQLEQWSANHNLERYLGYYFEYYQSMACPGKILRTLVCMEKQGEHVVYQRTERLQESPADKVFHGKYLGVVHYLTDRIFMSDYESLTGHELTQTILFPSFKNRILRLTGLKLGVSGSGERMPCCARVVYEYLGPQVDVLNALSLCGLYQQDSSAIDDSVRHSIHNDVGMYEWHFRARP
ncbi:transcriptional regulator [Bacterioplanes sanyensis]|uniref:Transcriptional regulator n=1 Tax=Bacterioplanes sanyensis TaxID=1249553 RepID=A0A222FNR4_9GAMM|nr:helix-turn-helix transcriptional regulator [Bacterioplanes sanyensis]ASP40154.1 transcriptional regulator [Bacterioplanes sanyensis]